MKKNNSTSISMADYITLINAACGFYAITVVMVQKHVAGLVLVILNCLLDLLDGKVARKTRASIYGGDLDSLTDIVTFGVTPAIVIFNVLTGGIAMFTAMVWLIAGILRLARYNSIKTPYFIGVPLSIAALFVLGLVVLGSSKEIILIGTLGMAFLMVSNIKVPKSLNGILSNSK
jgi:CDP-diacylglycerol--serine O-phosphatidyltransferase